jgi:hypothetical protein
LEGRPIGDCLGRIPAEWNIGIFQPLPIAAALKKGQGSPAAVVLTRGSHLVPR